MHKNTEQYRNDPEYRARQLTYKKKQQESWTPEQKAAKAAYLKEYRAKNKEHLAQLNKDYHERTKEDGRNRLWKDTELERTKERRKADPEYAEKRREACRTWYANKPREEHYERELRKEHGITQENVTEMKATQEEKCAICLRADRPLVVDHCHVSGAVRSLLCAGCNKGLGSFEDSADFLIRAAAYIQQHHPDKLSDGVRPNVLPAPGKLYQEGSYRVVVQNLNCLGCDASLAGKLATAKYCSRLCKSNAANRRNRGKT